jgi:hypothetical protein
MAALIVEAQSIFDPFSTPTGRLVGAVRPTV